MKTTIAQIFLLTVFSGAGTLPAQTNLRPIENGGGTTGVNVLPSPKQEKTIVKTTYTALSPDRQWTHRDGRSMLARLISHDTEVVAKQGSTLPASAIVVMKEGKVRLLREGKVHLLSIDHLSEKDQAFVKDKVDRIRRAANAEKKAKEPVEN